MDGSLKAGTSSGISLEEINVGKVEAEGFRAVADVERAFLDTDVLISGTDHADLDHGDGRLSDCWLVGVTDLTPRHITMPVHPFETI